MKRHIGALVLALYLMSGAAAFAAGDEHLPPSITVVGTAKAEAKPDLADINVGVESVAATAQAALAANNSAMSQLMATIKELNVPEKDVMTSNFDVQPQYRYPQGGGRPQITGYRVSNQVHIKMRKLNELGTMLDALVKSGANTLNGVSFSFAEPERLLDTVRGAAVADAHKKAELYAQATGVKVGRPLYIAEQGAHPIPPRQMPMAAMNAMAAAVPIAVGESQLSTTVTVVYAIE